MARNNLTNQQIYQQLEELMQTSKCYLNTSLTRKDICQMLQIDKNRLGQIIRIYSDCSNLQVYINRWRVRHAAQLFRVRPELTIKAIAEMSAIPYTSTFNRTFLHLYGQKPKQYRDQITKEAGAPAK